MIDIADFSDDIFSGENTLLLGNQKRKEKTFLAAVNGWCCADTPLVVLDYKGAIYERYNKKSHLMDMASENSVIADVIAPFLTNSDFGSSCENIAYMLRQFIYQEIKSRDANDKFFDDLGKLATDRMLTYMLVTAKNEIFNIASANREKSIEDVLPRINCFTLFCRQHKFIETIMTHAIGGERDILPNRRTLDEHKTDAAGALARYILECESSLQKNSDEPTPFADILFTTGENTTTQRCIKMQADASTADFRAMIAHIAYNAGAVSRLDTLKIDEWVQDPQEAPLFVASSGVPAADKGLVPLVISAVGAACRNCRKRAVVVIPEIDRWGLLNQIDKLRQNFDCLNFIISYDNFTRLALESRTDEKNLIEMLYAQSTQRLWHTTEEERLTHAFEIYSSAADVIYRPEDFDDELRAIERDGNISYLSLNEPDAGEIKNIRKKLSERKGTSKLWVAEGFKQFEPLTLESLLEDGETL